MISTDVKAFFYIYNNNFLKVPTAYKGICNWTPAHPPASKNKSSPSLA